MIRCYRLKNNLTQKELADIIGIDTRSLNRYESGASKPPIRVLKKLIETLKIKDKDIINYIKK